AEAPDQPRRRQHRDRVRHHEDGHHQLTASGGSMKFREQRGNSHDETAAGQDAGHEADGDDAEHLPPVPGLAHKTFTAAEKATAAPGARAQSAAPASVGSMPSSTSIVS